MTAKKAAFQPYLSGREIEIKERAYFALLPEILGS